MQSCLRGYVCYVLKGYEYLFSSKELHTFSPFPSAKRRFLIVFFDLTRWEDGQDALFFKRKGIDHR